MIAVALDTSALSRFVAGTPGEQTEAVASAIDRRIAVLPPIVVTELFSNPELSDDARALILSFPLLAIDDGLWERAGDLRAAVKRKVLKANVPDVLIAQSCIDHDIPLITYDRDFRHFIGAGLKLI